MQGLHTLVLFDLDPTGAGTGDQRPMQPERCIHKHRKNGAKFDDSEVDEALKKQATTLYESFCVLCCDLGTDDAFMKTTSIRDLKTQSGGRLNCMVFLANVSEMEQEAINRWK